MPNLSNVPLYLQGNYGSLTTPSTLMTKEGCAVCCAAMITSYKEKNTSVTPATMKSRGVFSTTSVYCNWDKASTQFSWGNQENSGNKTALFKEIKNQIDTWKDPVLIKISNPTWPHFVVAYGYTGTCTTAAQIVVRDPYSSSNTTLDKCFQTWPTYEYMRRLL